MKEWFKSYGSLPSAFFAGGWILWQLGHQELALIPLGIGALVLLIGVLSILFPMVRTLSTWLRAFGTAFTSLVLVLIGLLTRIYIAILAPLQRPIIKAVLAELGKVPHFQGNVSSSWVAWQKKYFLQSQQADILPLHDDVPIDISFVCSSLDPYWRAGVILADEEYDLHRNLIQDAVLVHLAVDPGLANPELYVYVSGTTAKKVLFDSRAEKYHVRIHLNHEEGLIRTEINTFRPVSVHQVNTRKFSKRVFLAAWADAEECKVLFENIQIS